jgi:Xaa-Pro aminopeptidase
MPITSEEMALRWKKIREAMTRYRIGGLLVFSDQTHPEPIHYVANYIMMGDKAFCYLPPDEDQPVLFISELWDYEKTEAASDLKDVRVIGENFYRELATLNKKYGGPLGIVGRENLTRAEVEAVESAMAQETVSATRLLEDVAIIKSPYELELIREAARMADAGFERAIEVVKEGMADYELGAEMNYVIRDMGATENFQMLAVGKEIPGMLLPYGKKVEPGDFLLFEITPAVGSVTYSAQACKTAYFGEIPDMVRDKYAILTEALEESLRVIRAGTKMSEVTRVEDEIFSKAGYEEYCRPPYMQQRGHGFGLGAIKLTKEGNQEFKEGMSCVVHPNQFIPEIGYLALGEQIIVTANGIERLTRTEPRIYECVK